MERVMTLRERDLQSKFRPELERLWHGMPGDDSGLWMDIVPGRMWSPDVTIAPDGVPYLYRWYLVPLNERSRGLVMFHLQVRSDPERPLHDHPWDNHSVLLAGGYDEHYAPRIGAPYSVTRKLRRGDTVAREATEAHRLVLPPDIPYTMTLFSTGPKVRSWGFWYPDGWVHNSLVVRDRDGVSVHVNREEV